MSHKNHSSKLLELPTFDDILREAPGLALEYHAYTISDEQFNYCFKQAPLVALAYGTQRLNNAQLNTCIKHFPRQTIIQAGKRLNRRQLDYLIGYYLIEVILEMPEQLTDAQWQKTINKSPEALLKIANKHPGGACVQLLLKQKEKLPAEFLARLLNDVAKTV